MWMNLIIANIVGVVALTLWVSSVQINKKNKILLIQSLANIFYAIQYFILGAIPASMMGIVSTVRCYIYSKNEEKGKQNSIFLLIIFIVIILIIAKLTVNNPIHLIPIFITLLYTYITWQKDNKILRIGFIIAAIIWIYYNYTVKAYVPIIGNIFEIISGIVAMLRFDTIKKNKSSDID